eukprot:m51a1_g11094 hypothetical protein (152) ;mRNA; f:35282-35796
MEKANRSAAAPGPPRPHTATRRPAAHQRSFSAATSSGYGTRAWSPPTPESRLMGRMRLDAKIRAQRDADARWGAKHLARASPPGRDAAPGAGTDAGGAEDVDDVAACAAAAAVAQRPTSSWGTRVVEAAPQLAELVTTQWRRPPTADWMIN